MAEIANGNGRPSFRLDVQTLVLLGSILLSSAGVAWKLSADIRVLTKQVETLEGERTMTRLELKELNAKLADLRVQIGQLAAKVPSIL